MADGLAPALTDAAPEAAAVAADAGQVVPDALGAGGAEGATGAFNPAGAYTGGNGLGVLAGREVTVTEQGLALISDHLSAFGDVPENEMMLQRLQYALDAGQPVSGADAVFYTHEAAEATAMQNLMGSGMSFEDAYEMAHDAALEKYAVSPFSVYGPEVIQALPERFNSAWRAFWGLSE